jgi:hypothetical protein
LQKNLQLGAPSYVIFRNIFIFSTKNHIQTENVLELSAVRKFEKKATLSNRDTFFNLIFEQENPIFAAH